MPILDNVENLRALRKFKSLYTFMKYVYIINELTGLILGFHPVSERL